MLDAWRVGGYVPSHVNDYVSDEMDTGITRRTVLKGAAGAAAGAAGAARLGADRRRVGVEIFWKITVPLSRPALAAMAILTFTYVWEDFLWPLIVISSADRYTAPLGLALFVTKNRTSWDTLLAGSVIATLPMIAAFLVFQRHLIKGLTVGAVKG